MPLLFDMSMDKLTSYQGTNPRPADFDDYWDAGLAELAATDPDVELVPADFQTPLRGMLSPLLHGDARRPRPCQIAAPSRPTGAPSRTAHVPRLQRQCR